MVKEGVPRARHSRSCGTVLLSILRDGVDTYPPSSKARDWLRQIYGGQRGEKHKSMGWLCLYNLSCSLLIRWFGVRVPGGLPLEVLAASS